MEYNNIPNEVIRLLKDFFELVKSKDLKKSARKALSNIDADLNNLPQRPKNNVFVSFQYESKSYDIAFSDYKIELSNYVNYSYDSDDHSTSSSESVQANCHRYEVAGYTDVIGDFDQFRSELLQDLEQVDIQGINIMDEE